MRKERREYAKSCALSEIVSVPLGGIPQKILIEGYREGQPVVLFLHGGPGFPAPFCVGARGLFPEITKKFTAVYWEQFGCGINNAVVDDGYTLAHFVRMTKDLIAYLKGRFPLQKLYLFAISFGTVLSARAADTEGISGVYAVGQIVLPPMLSPKAFAAIAQSKAPEKAKRDIAAIRTAKQPSPEQIALLSKTMRKYTSAYGIKDKTAAAENPMREIFASKDYTFANKLACFVNGYRKNTSLLSELSVIDLRKELAAVEIPYSIYGGECDLVTCVDEASALVEAARNPNLTVTVMAGEGHVPSVAVQQTIFAAMAQDAGL